MEGKTVAVQFSPDREDRAAPAKWGQRRRPTFWKCIHFMGDFNSRCTCLVMLPLDSTSAFITHARTETCCFCAYAASEAKSTFQKFQYLTCGSPLSQFISHQNQRMTTVFRLSCTINTLTHFFYHTSLTFLQTKRQQWYFHKYFRSRQHFMSPNSYLHMSGETLKRW